MAPTPPASADFDPAQLLAHRDFVRALARRLVFGDDDADELAQQTLVAAWTARPEPRAGLRGWLAKVALRLRDRGRRDDERRARRERGAADPESQPSAAELAAQIELEQRLAHAVSQLHEPYRSTLFLRYWHDLMPTAIAERDGVPVATVKSRLQRALAQLRVDLDAAHDGRREAWAGALIALAQAGVVTMTTTSKVACAAGIVLATGLAWQLLVAPMIESRDSSTIGPNHSAETPSAQEAAPPSTGDDPQPPLIAAERAIERLPFASAFVVDPEERPLADVAIVPLFLDRSNDRGFGVKPLVFDEADARSIARSDAIGAFVVAEMPDEATTLVLVKDGYEVVEWNDFSPNHDANQGRKFVLAPAREIVGVVRDTDGRPLPNAMVFWAVPIGTSVPRIANHLDDQPSFHPARSTTTRIAYSDVSGAFRLPSLPVAHGRMSVAVEGYAYFNRHEDEVAPSFDLTLRRNQALFDVRDAESGAPLRDAIGLMIDRSSGAKIETLHASDPRDYPEHQRRYLVPGRLCLYCGSGGGFDAFASWLTIDRSPHVLIARIDAPGHLAVDVAFEVDRDHEPPAQVVLLEAGEDEPSLAGRVIGGDGARIEVRPLLTTKDGAERRIDLRRHPPLATTTSDRDGKFTIGGLPAGHYRVDATAAGASPITARVEAPALDLTLAFQSSAALEITVTDRAGLPVPAVDVQVQLTDGSLAWSAKSGVEGTVTIESLPAGDFLVGAVPRGLGDLTGSDQGHAFVIGHDCFLEDERVTLAVGERRRLRVALPEPTAFVFHVVDQHATPLAGAELTIQPQHGLTTRVDDAERERVRALRPRTDNGGDARVDLLAGRHWVSATFAGSKSQLFVIVPQAAAGRVTLVVPVFHEFGAVEGRVFELGSTTPLGGQLVRAYFRIEEQGSADDEPVSAELASGTTDADGHFRFERIPVGSIRVVAWGNAGADGSSNPESPWHSTSCTIAVEDGKTTQVDLPIARDAPFAASLKSVAVTALLRDAKTGSPLAGASLSFQGRFGETEVWLGSVNTDQEGRAATVVPLCDSYEITLGGPRVPALNWVETYQRTTISLPSRDGRLVIEADLEPLLKR